MSKKISHISASLIILSMCIPQYSIAAELLFNASQGAKSVEVRINPESKEMNVVEGTIQFSGAAADGLSVQIENGQSVLPIWPTPPRYDDDNKSITFVGGVPNGFSSEGLLFRLQLSPKTSGDLVVAYVNGNGYLNDGNGTQETISSKPLEMYVDTNGNMNDTEVKEAQEIISPESPETYEGKDDVNHVNRYAIIILLTLVVLLIVVRYVFKKNHKK